MRKKNYWKECCLLLIGSLIGCTYHKHFDTLPSTEPDSIMVRDTIIIKDTLIVKSKKPIIPTLANVKAELIKQNIPHHEIVLKQAILESGNFKSKLTKTHNNIFGIRKNGQYKKYDSYVSCISDYKRLISKKYKGGDYYVFLRKINYAEDKMYIDKLKGMS